MLNKKNFTILMHKLTRHHYNNCDEYKKILDLVYGFKNNKDIESLPFLPAKLFKELDLKSITDEKVFKILNSSGTSNNRPSRIFLDKENAKSQTKVLNEFPENYAKLWLQGMRSKLGLNSSEENDLQLMNDLLAELHEYKVDYTQFFRDLAKLLSGNNEAAHQHFSSTMRFEQWLVRWRDRLTHDELTTAERIELMNQVNPNYIPRNHKVEEAIEAAITHEDYSKFEMLLEVLSQPYQVQPGKDEYAQPALKEFGEYKTFCGT